MSVTNAGNVI